MPENNDIYLVIVCYDDHERRISYCVHEFNTLEEAETFSKKCISYQDYEYHTIYKAKEINLRNLWKLK